MIKKIFNHQSKTIGFAAGILAASSAVNGFLALWRDRLLAGSFGAGESLDIYFAAFRIPDFIYGILIAGGIIAVFLPLFSEYFSQGKERGWYFTNVVLNSFLVLLILLCLIFLIFTPFIIQFITPGFSQDNKAQTVFLTRIMLLSPFFFVLSSIFSGILHYFNRFLIYSSAPILYNSGIIFGILFFVPYFGLTGLAYGVILGAFFHLAVQIPPVLLAGFKYQPVFNFKEPGLKKIFKLMVPRIIGAGASQLNLIIITAIASTLVSGSIAIFNFSNNLQKFPVELIGLSVATASFPVMARIWAAGQRKIFLTKFFLVFQQTLFIIIPLSLLIFLLRAQLVRIILGTGNFGWLETRLTAASLGVFSFALFTFCLIPLLNRAFFSLQDTKTPVIIGVITIVLNIALSFVFIWFLGFPNIFYNFLVNLLKLQGINNIQIIGLPLAFSLSGAFNFALLFVFFHKKIKKLVPGGIRILKEKIQEFFESLRKILIASGLMTIFTYYSLYLLAPFLDMQTFLGVFGQAVIAGFLGVFSYVFISSVLESSELKNFKLSILKQFKK